MNEINEIVSIKNVLIKKRLREQCDIEANT